MLICGFNVEGRRLRVWGAGAMGAGLCIVQSVVCVVVQQQRFGCVDGRVQLRAGVQVLSVQVHTPGIGSLKKEKDADIKNCLLSLS